MPFIGAFIVLTLILLAFACWKRRIGWYLAAGALPSLWLLAPIWLKPIVLADAQRFAPALKPLRDEFALWYWMPLALLFFVYTAYVWYGLEEPRSKTPTKLSGEGKEADTRREPDEDNPLLFYRDVIEPRKSIWSVFGIVLLGIAMFLTRAAVDVNLRVSGLVILSDSLANAVEDTITASSQLAETVAEKNPQRGYFAQVRREAGVVEVEAQAMRALATQIVDLDTSAPMSLTAQIAVASTNRAQEEIEQLGQTLISRSQQISVTAGTVTPQMEEACLSPEATGVDCDRMANQQARLIALTTGIDDIAATLSSTKAVLKVERTVPLAMIAALYSVLLLFPWLLCLGFILSKRGTIVRDNRRALIDLGLLNRVLDSATALGGRDKQPTRQAGRELAAAALELEQVRAGHAGSKDAAAESIRMACNYGDKATGISSLKWLQEWNEDSERDMSDPRSIDEAAKLVATARNEAVEIIITERLFFSREYVIPLVILTLLSGVGWYYVFFPDAFAGLAGLIALDGTAVAFTAYLTAHFTPVIMTFVGAWLFVAVMLLTRWTQDDLYPRAFFYSAVRLLVAFVVGLLFARWFQVSNSPSETPYLVLAFLVGAAPIEFLNAIFRQGAKGLGQLWNSVWHKNVLQDFNPPDWSSRITLRELQDLTIWDEVRLYQEGVQNVHALATADLEQLVLTTPFSVDNLVDWVDQALLRIHAGELWQPGFQLISIRTATELIRRCCPALAATELPATENDLDAGQVRKLVNAYNTIQQITPANNNARIAAINAGDRLLATAVQFRQEAGRAAAGAAKLDKDKPETLDRIVALRGLVQGLEGNVTRAADICKTIVDALDTPAGNQAVREAKQGWEGVAGTLTQMTTGLQQANAAWENDKLTREKLAAGDATIKHTAKAALEQAQMRVGELVKLAASARAAAGTAEDKTGQLAATDGVDTAKQKTSDAQAKLAELSQAAVEARDAANALDAANPDTWDAVRLLQTMLGGRGIAGETGLVEALQDLDAKRGEAARALDSLVEQQTLAIAEARQALDALTKSPSVQKARDQITAAVQAFQGLSADDTGGLEDAKRTVPGARAAVDQLGTEVEDVARQVVRASIPPQFSEEILQTMLIVMGQNANLRHVRMFRSRRGRADLSLATTQLVE